MKKLLSLSVLLVSVAGAAAQVPPTQNPSESKMLPSDELLKLRDPFKRPNVVSAVENAEPRTELEMFAIDQMRLLGVVTGPDKLRAMVLMPDGKTAFVAERMKIGTRKGVVKRITPDAIYVMENVVNALGQEEYVEALIKLPGEPKS